MFSIRYQAPSSLSALVVNAVVSSKVNDVGKVCGIPFTCILMEHELADRCQCSFSMMSMRPIALSDVCVSLLESFDYSVASSLPANYISLCSRMSPETSLNNSVVIIELERNYILTRLINFDRKAKQHLSWMTWRNLANDSGLISPLAKLSVRKVQLPRRTLPLRSRRFRISSSPSSSQESVINGPFYSWQHLLARRSIDAKWASLLIWQNRELTSKASEEKIPEVKNFWATFFSILCKLSWFHPKMHNSAFYFPKKI